ncbi:GNAT family N-acetyltransferase [Salinicola aestuarinus]|uniref:GNAT family N-acetyltransferase n=1 Tax=Salinicola aestuarinus TaxID=1949082 RepID=UPI001FD8BF52|nr:GNAT family protein [Salinicola aestuarinus]
MSVSLSMWWKSPNMTLTVSQVRPSDETTFLDAVLRSRALFRDWVDPPDSPQRFAAHLVRYAADNRFSYLARNERDQLIGCINLNDIVRGASQSASLGYYAFTPHSGQGLMKQAMARVIDRAFGLHGLHRLEANIQPDNRASAGLVRSVGFRLEGHSPRYLKIAGDWRDHDRYALTAEEW